MSLKPSEWVKEMPIANKVNVSIKVSNKAIGGEYSCYKNALQCIKCNDVIPLPPCSNCGQEIWVGAGGKVTKGEGMGLFCIRCEKTITRWACTKCGADNPLNSTMMKKK